MNGNARVGSLCRRPGPAGRFGVRIVLAAIASATAALLPSAAIAADDGPATIHTTTIAAGLNHPWSLAFLPNGDLLVTERNGGLRIVHAGQLEAKPILGVPPAFAESDGGLLGLTLHPDFPHNGLVYLCLSVGTADANASSVIRGQLSGRSLLKVTTIFTAVPMKKDANHFGCRLIFGPDGKLLVTLGDGR